MQYLEDLDRVYSVHVRPRFGKRSDFLQQVQFRSDQFRQFHLIRLGKPTKYKEFLYDCMISLKSGKIEHRTYLMTE